jgi:hypothetical protein
MVLMKEDVPSLCRYLANTKKSQWSFQSSASRLMLCRSKQVNQLGALLLYETRFVYQGRFQYNGPFFWSNHRSILCDWRQTFTKLGQGAISALDA